MPRTLALVLLVVLAASAAGAQPAPDLVEGSALGGRVALLVPADFAPMSAEMLALKYAGVDPPTEALTNAHGTVNVAFNHTQNPLPPDEIGALHVALAQMFKGTYGSEHWNRSRIIERGGRRYFLLDLWTGAVDTEIRNIMLGTSVDGRFLLVSFNVTRELEGVWGPVGERIMDSVEIRD